MTKAQAATGAGVSRWYRNPSTNGNQTEYVSGDALKAQVFLNNGGSWKDLPKSWKDDFKEKYQKNINSRGKEKILVAYKDKDNPSWFI